MSKKIDFTVVGNGASITGELDVPHDVRIDGVFNGTVRCGSTITVGTDGVVSGEISAINGEIAGKVEGNVSCSKALELNEGASIVGDVSAKALIINKGGVLHGRSSMLDEKNQKGQKERSKNRPAKNDDGQAKRKENSVEIDL
ncbi:bactofilin family protein [Chitinivibrio alkaliphilus]|uniref:Cell shape determination protein CcmA n=1 Tax=Chitinivibrio alkaliphilus ACht1 TaxID=1313304 RepID=U7D9N8_9BACT|nr:polymer-forming cytoskeletal protein [Chitinivibrio alkaliphilus]ERP31130.1 hypothetical protein CALK_2011 [Chitinivibrio alkaliphilus ACht1]